MRQHTLIAALAVGLIALTGCTAAPDNDAELDAEMPAEQTVETTAPLVAESAEPEHAEGEQAYLDRMRQYMEQETQIPGASDEQLLAAASDACTAIEGGALPEDVRVIDDETANQSGYYVDSSRIGETAAEFIC